jgi:exopolysaccharide production protein ExoQ
MTPSLTHSETSYYDHDLRSKRLTRLWVRVEIILVCFCLFMFSEALWAPLVNPTQDVTKDVGWLRLLWIPVYSLTVLLVILRWRYFQRIIPALIMCGLLMGLCYASSLWSIDPSLTLRRAHALVFTTLFALYLGARFNGQELTQIIAITFVGLALGSVLAVFIYPKMGVHSDVNLGAWRGLWHEKNQMASLMAIGFLACISSAIQIKALRFWWIAASALILFLVIMSQSKTSLLVCALSLCVLFFFMAIRRGGALSVMIVWGGVTLITLLASVIYFMPDMALHLVGKDPSLTGRTEIWASLLRLSEDRPWLGYGYKAFWAPDSHPAQLVQFQNQWDVPSAHNGWLDLLIQLGWVGVILFGLCLLVTCILGVLRAHKVNDGYFSLLILCLFSFLILSESFILSQNNLIWIFFITAMARVTALPLFNKSVPMN